MKCLICGTVCEGKFCSDLCVGAMENVKVPILEWFLQHKQLMCLRDLSIKGDPGVVSHKTYPEAHQDADVEADENTLEKIWGDIPVASFFGKIPVHDANKILITTILRARSGNNYKELGRLTPGENRDQLFDRCWSDDLTKAGYVPDYKDIY